VEQDVLRRLREFYFVQIPNVVRKVPGFVIGVVFFGFVEAVLITIVKLMCSAS
jgi:hypothetical protein